MACNMSVTARKEQARRGAKRGFSTTRLFGVMLLSIAVAVSCFGCSSRRPPPPQMKLHVDSDQATNNGQLFYLVVRGVTDKQFLSDSYQAVAATVFADPPDKTVIGTHVVLPGLQQLFQVIQPEETPVAFYFLFTNPGDQWKKIIDQPLAKDYNIKIRKDEITIKPERSMWKRILWPFGS